MMTEEARRQRIFCGSYPCGLVFADRTIERDGDYKRLAFLPYDTLEIEFEKDCPGKLADEIVAWVKKMNLKKGDEYRISTCGQTITLGQGKGTVGTPRVTI
jgi:hypothetical protein